MKKDANEIIKAIKKEQKKQGSNTDPLLLVILAIGQSDVRST